MTKFYMTKTPLGNGDYEPIAINLDSVLKIRPAQDSTAFTMLGSYNIYVSKDYKDVMMDITPFVPFNEMVNDDRRSDWMRNYLNDLPKGVSVLVNDNNG